MSKAPDETIDTTNYWYTVGGSADLWSETATTLIRDMDSFSDTVMNVLFYNWGGVNHVVYMDAADITVWWYKKPLYCGNILGWPTNCYITLKSATIEEQCQAMRTTAAATYWDLGVGAYNNFSMYDAVLFASNATGSDLLYALDENHSTFPTIADSVISIGMEQIQHEGLTDYGTQYAWVNGPLVRGYASSQIYNHSAEAPVFDCTYSKSDPATTSSIYSYGVRTKTIYTFGFCDQDQLDHIAYNYLQLTKDPIEYGSAYYCDSDFATIPTIGDQIYIVDASGVSVETRLVGIDYDQHQPVRIYFGMTEDYYLEDYNTSMKSYDIAVTK